VKATAGRGVSKAQFKLILNDNFEIPFAKAVWRLMEAGRVGAPFHGGRRRAWNGDELSVAQKQKCTLRVATASFRSPEPS